MVILYTELTFLMKISQHKACSFYVNLVKTSFLLTIHTLKVYRNKFIQENIFVALICKEKCNNIVYFFYLEHWFSHNPTSFYTFFLFQLNLFLLNYSIISFLTVILATEFMYSYIFFKHSLS